VGRTWVGGQRIVKCRVFDSQLSSLNRYQHELVYHKKSDTYKVLVTDIKGLLGQYIWLHSSCAAARPIQIIHLSFTRPLVTPSCIFFAMLGPEPFSTSHKHQIPSRPVHLAPPIMRFCPPASNIHVSVSSPSLTVRSLLSLLTDAKQLLKVLV
jgi:hypothetical protein